MFYAGRGPAGAQLVQLCSGVGYSGVLSQFSTPLPHAWASSGWGRRVLLGSQDPPSFRLNPALDSCSPFRKVPDCSPELGMDLGPQEPRQSGLALPAGAVRPSPRGCTVPLPPSLPPPVLLSAPPRPCCFPSALSCIARLGTREVGWSHLDKVGPGPGPLQSEAPGRPAAAAWALCPGLDALSEPSLHRTACSRGSRVFRNKDEDPFPRRKRRPWEEAHSLEVLGLGCGQS